MDQSVTDLAGERGAIERDPESEALANRGAPDPEWSQLVWYRSRVGIGVIAADLLLTALVAGATVVAYEVPFGGLDRVAEGIVPPYVYAFCLFGALGFVFTALIEEFESTVGDLLRYNLRLPAALPLGVGVYLLSGVVLGEGASAVPLVAGTVFLAGLYVNLAYKQLGALARRLLPGEGAGE